MDHITFVNISSLHWRAREITMFTVSHRQRPAEVVANPNYSKLHIRSFTPSAVVNFQYGGGFYKYTVFQTVHKTWVVRYCLW